MLASIAELWHDGSTRAIARPVSFADRRPHGDPSGRTPPFFPRSARLALEHVADGETGAGSAFAGLYHNLKGTTWRGR